MTTEYPLSNCPFCGGKAESFQEGTHNYWRTCCANTMTCGHRGSAMPTLAESVAAWNRRVTTSGDMPALEAPIQWRCFHCNYVAHTREEAAAHFGYAMNERPASCITSKVFQVALRPMSLDSGRKGWYFRNADFYIDVEEEEEAGFSVFFRDSKGKELFVESGKQVTPGFWSCVEADCISRGFDHTEYLNYITKVGTAHKPVHSEVYDMLSDAYHHAMELDNGS